jgi:hypothetical protein
VSVYIFHGGGHKNPNNIVKKYKTLYTNGADRTNNKIFTSNKGLFAEGCHHSFFIIISINIVIGRQTIFPVDTRFSNNLQAIYSLQNAIIGFNL